MESRIVGDLQNIADFAGVVEGAEAIVHLAARVHQMRETASDPEAAFILANTDVTEKLGELREKEVNFLAREVYESMRQNQEAADKLDALTKSVG